MDFAIYKTWLIGVGIGSLIAALVAALFLKARPSADGREFSIRVGSLWPGAVMIGICAIAGWVGLTKTAPFWPPVASDDRLGWVYCIVAALSLFFGLLQKSFAVRAGLAIAAAAFAAAFTLYSPSAGIGALSGRMLDIVIAAGGMLIAIASLGATEWRGRRVVTPFILTGLALAVGGAVFGSSSSKLGFFAWAIVPPAAIATAVCALRKGATLGSAAYVCAVCALGATVMVGFHFNDLRPTSAIIFALCPLLALIADAVLTPMLKPRTAAIACVLAAAIPAAVAMAISIKLPEAS